VLDPGKRKCQGCYDDQKKWGTPIPNCSNPDGDGLPCPWPEIESSLMAENIMAWRIWSENAAEIVGVEATLAGPIFTLNSAFLAWILEKEGVRPTLSAYRKIRAIFGAWKGIQGRSDQSKTDASMARTQRLKSGRKTGRGA